MIDAAVRGRRGLRERKIWRRRRGQLPLAAAIVMSAALAGCVNPVGRSLYQPAPLAATPAWTGRTPRSVEAVAADGARLKGWFWPSETTTGPVLVYLPGRAGNRDVAAKAAQAFARDGRGVLVASYRGYGDDTGVPDEQGLYQDGRAFVDLAKRLVPDGKRFVFGDGLSAAVALHAQRKARPERALTGSQRWARSTLLRGSCRALLGGCMRMRSTTLRQSGE